MTAQLKELSTPLDVERQARVDLATCYRLVRKNNWCNSIYNHCTARIPGEPDFMLMKAHPLLWDEVTASNLVKVNIHEELDESAGVNRPGFVLHSAIMRARPEVGAAVHIHEEASTAISATEEGLLPLTQDGIFLRKKHFLPKNPEKIEKCPSPKSNLKYPTYAS